MRRIFLLSSLFIFITLSNVSAQKDIVCRPGFTYTLSESPNWGTHLPVITAVSPYTSAESVGLKYADIILKINGISTVGMSTTEIDEQLNLAGNKDTALEIKNLAKSSRTVFLKRDCKAASAVTENQLASVFEMYGLDFTNERMFLCPFKTIAPDSVDFARFKTFSFAAVDEANEKIETALNDCIENELTQKGLLLVDSSADLLVETFYYFDKNSNYVGQNKVSTETPTVKRYNSTTGLVEKFPFLRLSASNAEAEYLLQLGFRLVDKTDTTAVSAPVIWECEANERLTEPYSLEEYARIFVPLMCMQYPFVKDAENVRFKASYKTYNYTGIGFNKDSLSQVVDVDQNGPAYAAGIRANDRVLKINKQDAALSIDQLSAAYREFVLASYKYRDATTRFTNAANIKSCMFWAVDDYAAIAEMVKENKYHALFSYLYNFAPYINPTGINTCQFEVVRNLEVLDILVRPTIRTEFTLSIE